MSTTMTEPEDRGRARRRDTLDLWSWRRAVAELYAVVRIREPEFGWALWRETRDHLFRTHPQTPLAGPDRDGFAGLPYYAYDPAYRFEVGTEPVGAAGAVAAEVGRDGTVSFSPFCRTVGLAERLGGELTLYWIGGYGGGVFLPFRDATSGQGTYGGGRYLLDTIKGADLGPAGADRLVLDFNFAYNPSCSYSPDWVCPLSPPENRLRRPVEAGERHGG